MWYTCSMISNHAGVWNSSLTIFVCAIVIIMTAKIFITTWISHFSINLIWSTFRLIIGLVIILNRYCSL